MVRNASGPAGGSAGREPGRRRLAGASDGTANTAPARGRCADPLSQRRNGLAFHRRETSALLPAVHAVLGGRRARRCQVCSRSITPATRDPRPVLFSRVSIVPTRAATDDVVARAARHALGAGHTRSGRCVHLRRPRRARTGRIGPDPQTGKPANKARDRPAVLDDIPPVVRGRSSRPEHPGSGCARREPSHAGCRHRPPLENRHG